MSFARQPNTITLSLLYKKLLYKKVEAQIVQKLRNLLYDDVIVTIKGFEAHFRKQLSYKKKIECILNLTEVPLLI